MNKVFITGIGGFVGSALARRLLAEGREVVGIVRDLNSVPPVLNVPRCHVLIGDVRDIDCMRSVISYYEVDTVFHFAANAIVRVSAKDPVSTYAVNVMGTVNVLDACRVVGGVRKIVVASSDKAYGDHEVLPYTERHELKPKNTYDTSKACMDMVARTYASNYDMPIVVTRCSNVYGPGDMNMSRIVPSTIARIINNRDPMIYSDIEQMRREFIYIDDVVDAYAKIGWHDDATASVYNIGGTGEVEIGELVKMICREMGHSGNVIVENRDSRFREIQKQYIDASLLSNHTGWRPQVTLAEGIKKSVDWYEAYVCEGKYL